MAKRTRVSIETDSLLIVRGQRLLQSWCPQCGGETEMIALDTLGVVSNLSPKEVQAWMESPELHRIRRSDGVELVCLNSILQWVQSAGGEEPPAAGSPPK
jgi:hypothetical protein